jgi:acyl-CoA reductase-like NAD-dependent aldehyde dehydrogenase
MNVFPNLIAGEAAATQAVMANINPSDTRDIIGEFSVGTRRDVDAAIAAAAAAFPLWSRTNALVRFEILDRIGAEISARSAEIGDMLAREEGKTLKEATAEVLRAGQLFKFFAAEAYRATSEGLPSVRDQIGLTVSREPIGVVGIITPWNFPIAIPAWKIAPALAYGNTVVFKPAELVPGSAWLLADIINRAGLPKGTFNLIMGHGAVVGEAIVSSPKVAGVSFTGSTRVGKAIGHALFERGARMQLEMGGKNPLLVLDDAPLEMAVDCALQGAFFSTGQRCTASSRLIVTPGIHDAFVARLRECMAALVIGDARDPATQIGPVVSEAQLAIDESYLEIGRREGACLAQGGERLNRKAPGYYLNPALFTETTNEMSINRNEIFGPIAAVIPARDYEEALMIANDTEAGLSSGIVTKNAAIIRHFRENAEAGMIQVNLPTAGMDFHAPFTGRKQAGYGPAEKGSYAREFFTAVKVTHERFA